MIALGIRYINKISIVFNITISLKQRHVIGQFRFDIVPHVKVNRLHQSWFPTPYYLNYNNFTRGIYTYLGTTIPSLYINA